MVEEAPFPPGSEDEKARLSDGEVKRDYRYTIHPLHPSFSPRAADTGRTGRSGWADRGKDLLVMKLTGRGRKSPSS